MAAIPHEEFEAQNVGEQAAFYEGQRQLLVYLLGLATEHKGSEIWRALLAEIFEKTDRQLISCRMQILAKDVDK